MMYLEIKIKRKDRLDEAPYGNPSFDIEESICGRQHYQPSPLIPSTIHETTSYLPANHILTLDTNQLITDAGGVSHATWLLQYLQLTGHHANRSAGISRDL